MVTQSPYKPQLLGASLKSLAASYGIRWWPQKVGIPWAFKGSADEGTALANSERAKKLQRPGRTATGQMCTSHYSGGGRRLRSFLSSSPFQYLKLSSRCCIRLGRSTKAGETNRDAVSS